MSSSSVVFVVFLLLLLVVAVVVVFFSLVDSGRGFKPFPTGPNRQIDRQIDKLRFGFGFCKPYLALQVPPNGCGGCSGCGGAGRGGAGRRARHRYPWFLRYREDVHERFNTVRFAFPFGSRLLGADTNLRTISHDLVFSPPSGGEVYIFIYST